MRNVVKFKFLSILALASITSLFANDSTRSFFSVRPFYDTLTSQNLMMDQEHGMGKVDKKRNLQFNAFVSHSREPEKLARYFFQGKNVLLVKETAPGGDNTLEMQQDILARDFNIIVGHQGIPDFKSQITIAPRQRVYGGSLSLRAYMGEKKQWSWAVEVPVVFVNNDLQLVEDMGGATFIPQTTLYLDQQPVVASMKDAFRQKGMLYGKIDGAQKSKGLGNVVVKVGYEPCSFCTMDDKYMNTYVGLVLPTDNKPEAEYMFEPMRGNNGHTGVVMGTSLESLMRSGKSINFWSRWNIESRYLFENTQKRSFDLLVNGVWSRYLSMFENAAKAVAQQPTFGINLLTRDAKVRPGYQCTIDAAFCVAGERWHASIGSTTFAHQAEKIKLAQEWTQAPYIAALADITATNRTRQSGREYFNNDFVGQDVAIKESDLDLDSASHPAAISQMIYATLGGYRESEKPCMYEIGASYEFSCMNTSLNRWGVWATLQSSF